MKAKLGKKKIFVDHDLTEEEAGVQRILREESRKLRAEGKEVRVGYRKISIQEKWHVCNDEKGMIEEKKFFRK